MAIEERGPDFMGHDINWSDDDGEGFSLEMSLTLSQTEPGRLRWGYTFRDNQFDADEPIFSNSDFQVPDSWNDPQKIVSELLGWLSLQDGDTDAEYFLSYNERQIQWRDERAETLSIYANDMENADD